MTHPGRAQRIAIVGAGYAGMAAAVELTLAGHTVEVFETSRTLGGRARSTQISSPAGPITVDNGQHILVGAYRETLRLIGAVGVDPITVLRRTPLHLEFPGEFRMVAPHLPAPLHTAFALLGARGLDWKEKWAAIQLMRCLERNQFRVLPDVNVSAWLDQNQVPPRQRQFLWEPLCIAALNTPAEHASAQVLATVLHDSLAGSRDASDLLLPQVNLSDLFPEPAARFITEKGGKIHRNRRVTAVISHQATWLINEDQAFDQVILAVAPYHLGSLVPSLTPSVAHLTWEPIVTSYFSYPKEIKLPQPMLGVANGLSQWLFDRGQLIGPESATGTSQQGMIAAVISAKGRHLDLPIPELEQKIHEEIGRILPNLPAPLSVQTITEKRATFACTPKLKRPTTQTEHPGLWLAGDYVAGDYPATLEGAIRSGVIAAQMAARAEK